MLVYVHKILHLTHYLKEDMDALNRTYRLEDDSVGTPNRYLGDNFEKVRIENGRECW